jgi:hypothetical protein
MKELPKEAPDEVHKIAQLLIARFKEAGKDASEYIYFSRDGSEQIPEEWAIEDNFQRNDALIFKVATSQWCHRGIATDDDVDLSGLGGAIKAVRAWRLNPNHYFAVTPESLR